MYNDNSSRNFFESLSSKIDNSVGDPGCLFWIHIFFHLGPGILDSKITKKRGGFLWPVFVVNNFTKL